MFKFVLEKLLHKKWIILCLLIGNVLLVGIASCNPMYMRASLQKMLTSSLNAYLEETMSTR
jgi:putative ABC transport system permease protein